MLSSKFQEAKQRYQRYSGLPRFSCTLKFKRTSRTSQTMGLSPPLDTILIAVSTSNNKQYCKKVKYFHFILSHFLSNLIDVIKRNKLISSYFQSVDKIVIDRSILGSQPPGIAAMLEVNTLKIILKNLHESGVKLPEDRNV